MKIQKNLHHGDLHLSKGKAAKAISFYDTVLNHDRNCFNAWLGKGTALKTLKRYQEALECYERALLLDKNSVMAEFLAGYLRYKLHKNQMGKNSESLKRRNSKLHCVQEDAPP